MESTLWIMASKFELTDNSESDFEGQDPGKSSYGQDSLSTQRIGHCTKTSRTHSSWCCNLLYMSCALECSSKSDGLSSSKPWCNSQPLHSCRVTCDKGEAPHQLTFFLFSARRFGEALSLESPVTPKQLLPYLLLQDIPRTCRIFGVSSDPPSTEQLLRMQAVNKDGLLTK